MGDSCHILPLNSTRDVPCLARAPGPAGSAAREADNDTITPRERGNAGSTLATSATATLPLAHLLPVTAGLSDSGALAVGGCDLPALAREHGTPLYVYDLATIQRQARSFLEAFRAEYPDTTALYAAKAFLNRPFARLIAAEGYGFDAVSGGELAVMLAAGVDPATIHLHGNNKAPDELQQAVAAGVGRVVVDNLDEIALLDAVSAEAGLRQPVLLRVSPGVDAHTHEKTTTGVLDSKFGVAIASGDAKQAARRIAEAEQLDLRGLHMHLGSPIFELAPYERGIEVVAAFWADVCRDRLGLDFDELSVGGGFAVGYEGEHDPPAPAAYARAIAATLRREADARGLDLPRLVIEPGRALVARAGIALYTVGARKEIAGVRSYVSVDGGMADNVRPSMYGSRYEVLSAERPLAPAEETVTIAGKYCESGDLLARDVALPRLRAGEIVAMPAAGAYQLAMASNYNLATRPAVLLLANGAARLLRRRETHEDLMALDVDP